MFTPAPRSARAEVEEEEEQRFAGLAEACIDGVRHATGVWCCCGCG
jgi:hypothetical protein